MPIDQHTKYLHLKDSIKFKNLMTFIRVLSNISICSDTYPPLNENFLPISFRARKELKQEINARLNWQYWIEMHNYTYEQKINKLYFQIITNNCNTNNEHIYDAIVDECKRIDYDIHRDRSILFELAKKIKRTEGYALTLDVDKTLEKIKKHGSRYGSKSLSLTLAIDEDFQMYDERSFKQKFSSKINIPYECIDILSVKSGSTIINMKIKESNKHNTLLIPIECIAEQISSRKAYKSLHEFSIFAMEFGAVSPDVNKFCDKDRIIMNPRWNKEYGPGTGKTYWKGPLNDGKSRDGEPYYCPSGWKRFSIQFKTTPYDFDKIYDKWPIAYHATSFHNHMAICLTGFRCSDKRAVHGPGVYLSPSIEYCACPKTYAIPIKLDLNDGKTAKWKKEHYNLFKEYHNKWIQCIFAVRVKPGSYKKYRETMSLSGTKFGEYDTSSIEWVVHGTPGTYYGNHTILIYGLMIKATDKKPISFRTDI